MPAPILLFAFNRPEHLKKTLAALAANELASASDLFIICDGPRHDQDIPLCAAVQKTADKAAGFKSVNVSKKTKNCGLASSVIAGVTEIVNEKGRAIVMEDDLVTSPYFLRYMNDGLELYADNPKVASIHGWCFPHGVPQPPETFFLRGADCWGWATWKRAWDIFEADAAKLLKELQERQLVHNFDLDGSYSYSGMLRQVIDGSVSSWAVRWHASSFLADKYTLYPGRPLVQNIGLDNSGTHCGTTTIFEDRLSQKPVAVSEIAVGVDHTMRSALVDFFRPSKPSGGGKESGFKKLRKKIRKCLPSFLRGGRKKDSEKKGQVLEWEGDYPDWQSACEVCGDGYSNDEIFARVTRAAWAVHNQEALWDRDSVLFHHEEYSWALVAGLMAAAVQNNGRLHVLDFGGALGSTFHQNKRFLNLAREVVWHIVEQPHVVDYGQANFTDGQCKFHHTMADCLRNNPINVILFSSVLQYMPDPYALLQEAVDSRPQAIIIDRTPFLPGRDQITVQRVPEDIYPAAYPCWRLNRARVGGILAGDYTCFPDYPSPVDPSGFYGFLALKKEAHV